MDAIDYNEILTETLRIISQPWSLFDAPPEMWNMLDPDSQGRQIRVWLVEHMQFVFEREFRLLLRERYLSDDTAVTTDGPIDSDQAISVAIGFVVSGLLCYHLYNILVFLWAFINGG